VAAAAVAPEAALAACHADNTASNRGVRWSVSPGRSTARPLLLSLKLRVLLLNPPPSLCQLLLAAPGQWWDTWVTPGDKTSPGDWLPVPAGARVDRQERMASASCANASVTPARHTTRIHVKRY
jgi:hypothetical protein